MNNNTTTIVAPITPLIKSAVIVIRISGPNALKIFSLMENVNGKKVDVEDIKPNYTSLYKFNIKKENISDDVLVTFFKGPNSFTGEDVVEISFHGNPILVNSALSEIYSLGIKPAQGGEFSKRAFLNGKIDLTQAEAIKELIEANSLEGVSSAYNQLKGFLKHQLDYIKDVLLKMKAIMEAKIDFPDEDTTDDEINLLKDYINDISPKINNLISSYKSYRQANMGVEIVLAGRPNVGKSSLMNAILKDDRAIVSDTAGTTRDFIKESLYIAGIPVFITDTAGVRKYSEDIEKIGIDKSIDKIKSSDILLLILDISCPLTDDDYKLLEDTKEINRIIIGNKLDKKGDNYYSGADIYISAKNNINIDELISLIKERVGLFNNEVKTGGQAITQRHYNNLSDIKDIVDKINDGLLVYPIDMLCLDLEQAINIMTEITGENYTEKVLDIVFSSFCIGK